VTLLEWHPYRHVHPLAFAFFPILLQTYHAFLVNVIEKFSIGKIEVEELDIGLRGKVLFYAYASSICFGRFYVLSKLSFLPQWRHSPFHALGIIVIWQYQSCSVQLCLILGTTYTTVFGTRTACFALFNMEYLHTLCGWFSLQTEIWHQEVGCNSSDSKVSCSYKTSNQICDPICEKPIKDTPTIGNMFMSQIVAQNLCVRWAWEQTLLLLTQT